MTDVSSAVRSAAAHLAAAGVASPEHDARALAAHVLGLDRPTDLLRADGLTPDQVVHFDGLVARRATREPLQHLLGSAPFRRIDLLVGPGAFVPRPETEVVVEAALDLLADVVHPVVVDLCTGPGTIALALASELPGAVVHAVELSEEAVGWAKRNVDALGLPVQLHLGDAEHALPDLDGSVDLVISNPPYVATHERHIPDPEVLDHDPHVALFAGADGLDVVRAVERAARRLLRPDGFVVVEHSDRQGTSAPDVFRAAGGWVEVTDFPDLTGRDRFLTARWPGDPA